MSDRLAVVQSEESVKEIRKIIAETRPLLALFRETAAAATDLSQSIRSGGLRDYNNAVQGATQATRQYLNVGEQLSASERRLAQVERQLAIAQSEHAQQIANISAQTRQLTAAQRERAVVEARLAALSEQERQRIGNTIQIYNAVQNRMNALQLEYRNLALAKELGMSLTNQEKARYEQLQKQIQRYDSALKAVDASMGIHRRNVGNYASGYNGLNMSVAQLAREMPAFTYSIQTGFMALSNNIPIFMDSIKAAIAQNKQLRSEGKATVPVWRQLGLAVFGFNTILSIGITLLTVYGKEVGEWAKSLFQGSGAASILKKNIEDLNKARQEAAKSAASEISKLETLYRVSTNENASRESRIRAINKLQDLYPSFFKNISDETIMVGKAKDAYIRLRGAILDSARARAIGNVLEKRQEEQLLKEEAVRKKLSEAINTGIELDKKPQQTKSEYVRDGQGGLILKEVSNNELSKRNDRLIVGYQYQLKKLGNDFVKLNQSLIDQKTALENKKDVLNYEGDKNGKDEKNKGPKSAQLTAAQKDYLNNLQAEKDDAIAIQKEKWMNLEIDEKTYWENYLKIIKTYRDAVASYLKGSNAKERQVEAGVRKRAVDELEKANKEIYDYEKNNLEENNKMKINLLEKSANDIEQSDYLTDFDRLTKQIDIDNQIINELSRYYENQIELAKKAGESVIEWENKRDEEIGKIQDERMKKMNSLPDAAVKEVERQSEILNSQKNIGYEEQRRLILQNKKLTVEERNYQLNVLEKQNQIDVNQREIERLQTLRGQLVVKQALNQVNGLPPLLSPEDEKQLYEIDAMIAKINNENDQNKRDLNLFQFDKMAEGFKPLFDLLQNGFNDLGLNKISDQFSKMYQKISDEGKEFSLSNKEIFQAASDVISDFSNLFLQRQKQNSIAALDEQLKVSQENTDLEIGFINNRLEAYSNMDDLTKEQIEDRNRLEDQARTFREQQQQREKLIATQKAKAEQKAAAQQALINGALAATQTLAQLGFVAGAIPAALALAFGIAQSIAISSKNPIPQYWKGRERGPAEMALTQERGREIITDKHGNIKDLGSDGGAKMTWLEKDDKVITADKTRSYISRLKELKEVPKLGANMFRKIAMNSLRAPVVNVTVAKPEYNSDKIAKKVGEEVARQLGRFNNPTQTRENGVIFKYKGAQIREITGYYDVATGKEISKEEYLKNIQ